MSKPPRTPALAPDRSRRTAVTSAVAAPKSRAKGALKVDILEDLAQAIRGRDKFTEVLRMSHADVLSNITGFISTQSIAVDCATNVGGLPRGRLVEVYGQPEVGKTTLWQAVMAQTQRQGGYGALHDSEEKTDKNYARAMGVDIDNLLAIQPDFKTVEAIAETTDRALDFWMAHYAIPLTIVWDTIAGSASEDEMENPSARRNQKGEVNVHNFSPASAARALRRLWRQVIGKIARSDALLLAINQQYVRVGAYSARPGQVQYSTYGGGGTRYHATMRLEMVRVGALKDFHDNMIGIEGICKIFKNNLAIPRDESYAIQWGRGFSNAWSIYTKLKERKVIQLSPRGNQGTANVFSMQGVPPVEWFGGWQGFEDMLVRFPELYNLTASLYQQLPGGAIKRSSED